MAVERTSGLHSAASGLRTCTVWGSPAGGDVSSRVCCQEDRSRLCAMGLRCCTCEGCFVAGDGCTGPGACEVLFRACALERMHCSTCAGEQLLQLNPACSAGLAEPYLGPPPCTRHIPLHIGQLVGFRPPSHHQRKKKKVDV